MTDGKITANFCINGLPKLKNADDFSSSYVTIPKIFDDMDDFSEYAEGFLSKSDEDLIALSKESKKESY